MDVLTLRRIDEKKTRNNVRRFFKKDYPRICSLAGMDQLALSSATIDDMPKAPSYRNANEDAIMNHLEHVIEYDQVKNAIKHCSFISQQIILFDLIHKQDVQTVADALKYSKPRYNDLKNYALIEFADTYEYQSGDDLHSYSDKSYF